MSLPPQLQHYLNTIDRQFAGNKLMGQFEQQTGLPRSALVLGGGAVYFLLVFLNIGGLGGLLTNIAGFVLPAYYSLIALKTSRTDDDTHLLTYWVVFAFLNVLEFWSNAILYWVPFYYVFKLVFLLWIGNPYTNGAELVYRHLVEPIGDLLIRATESRGGVAEEIEELAQSHGKKH